MRTGLPTLAGNRWPGTRGATPWFLLALTLGLLGAPTGLALALDLRPGDIVFNEPSVAGEILRLDPRTGDVDHIALGSLLSPAEQRGLAVDAGGNIYVLVWMRLAHVDVGTGVQRIVTANEHLVDPARLAFEPDGTLVVTDAGDTTTPPAVVRVDPATGDQSVVTSGGLLTRPMGIHVDPSGTILVADVKALGVGAIIEVDPESGFQRLVAAGDPFAGPLDITRDGEGRLLALISSVLPGDCPGGKCGGIVQVDELTGAMTIVAAGEVFTGPRSMALEPDGGLVVADYFAFSDAGPRILRVDPATGEVGVATDRIATIADVKVVPGEPEPQPPACGDGAVNLPGEMCDGADAGSCPGPCRPDCTCYEGPAPGDLLVLDLGLKGVVAVDHRTGDRTILSGGDIGGGVELRYPQGLGLGSRGEIFVGDYEVVPHIPFPQVYGKLLRVDPGTGDRTILSARDVGQGLPFDPPSEIDVDASGDVLVATSSPYTGLIRVDPESGDRSTISSAGVGAGPLFYYPDGMEIESDGHVLLTQRVGAAVLRIDPLSGDRVLVTGGAPPGGSGARLMSPTALGLEDGGSLLVGDAGNGQGEFTALLRVDPQTGARMPLSGCVNDVYPFCREVQGSGVPFLYPHGIAVDRSGGILVADAYRDAVYRVDPGTGDRVEISSPRVGQGPELLHPWNMEIVPADFDGDGDGVLDDGDGSGVVGDDPCGAGRTVGCDDNCPRVANADQLDRDGDGVGDACDDCASVPSPGMSHAAAAEKARPADRALEARGGPVPLKPSHGCSADPPGGS